MTRDSVIAVIAGLVGTALALLISRDWAVLAFQSDPLSFCASALLLLLLGVMIGLAVSVVHKKALDSRIGKVAKRTVAEEIVPVSHGSIDEMFKEDRSAKRE